jgi:multiple sugar transport system substrate-binding protein
MHTSRRTVLAAIACTIALAACGDDDKQIEKPGRADTTCDGKLDGTTHLTVWFHASATVNAEREVLLRQVARFNATHRTVQVRLVTLPEGNYSQQVRSAAATGNLPDILDFDGPNLYNYAWTGKIKPIDSCLSGPLRRDLLPSLRKQGTYNGRMWGIGTFDSGLGLYVRPSIFKSLGISLPTTPEEAWSVQEFQDILEKLRDAGYRRPLDLKLGYLLPEAEWPAYGFAPMVWSAGGDLIDRKEFRRIDGFFNGEPAVRAFSYLRDWARGGYVDPDEDGKAFVSGRSPISWVGHWVFEEYREAHRGDIAIVPLPDLGTGTASGMGSWQWGITANATDGDAAWQFLSFLLRPEEVLRMTDRNGAIPATRSAVRASDRFAPGGAEHLYVQQLESGVARPRPQTPAYPAISRAFNRAFTEVVIERRPVRPALDAAARRLERDLVEHQYYPPTEPE